MNPRKTTVKSTIKSNIKYLQLLQVETKRLIADIISGQLLCSVNNIIKKALFSFREGIFKS